jgi:hypothetical protein
VSLLGKYSTPAERARGCRFVDLFESADAVARNGGVIAGNPEIDFSLDCKAAGSVRYPTTDKSFLGKSGTVFIRLRAGSDAGTGRFFGSNDTGGREFRSVLSGVSSQLVFPMTGSVNKQITINNPSRPFVYGIETTFAVTWEYDGARTDFVGYQDGTQRATSAEIGEYVQTPNDYLAIGDWNASYFDGEIFEAKFFNEPLTAQEIADLHNNTTYEYRNESSLYLPMGMAQHDPTNLRTLDISGNGRHAQFGDGVTPSTYPTKSPRRHGYGFDGVDDYLVANGSFLDTDAITWAFEFTPDFDEFTTQYHFFADGPAGERNGVFFTNQGAGSLLGGYIGAFSIGSIGPAVYRDFWMKGARSFLILAGTPNDLDLWLNSPAPIHKFVNNWSAGPTNTWVFGQNYGFSAAFLGQMHSFRAWPKALTPMQILDLTIRAERERWQP